MGKKRVHTFSTWADAEAAYNTASKMAGALDIALGELVRGSVKWLEGEQPRKVGLCKLAAPNGGVVILVEQTMVGAIYLNDWLERVEKSTPPTKKEYMPEYKAWVDVRRLATTAKKEQELAQQRAFEEAKGCERIAPPQEVDQDVRTY